MQRWYIYLILAIVVFFGILIGGLEYLARTNVDPVIAENVEIQKRHLEAFVDDQEFLTVQGFFAFKKTGVADASAFLNSKLAWVPMPNGQTAGREMISPDLRERILRYKNDWIRHYPRTSFKGVDLSFFSGLEAFDHWDLEANSPIADLIKSNEFVHPGRLPNPDTLDMITLTKLRLMKGALEKEPLVALREVRKFAQLLMTTESIHQQLNAIAVLNIERRAYRFYVEREMMGTEAWQPIEQNITRRANRALWATRGYLHLWTPKNVLHAVFLSERFVPIGLCSAVNEALPAEYSLKSLLASKLPLERDYRDRYRDLQKIYERALESCRLKYVTRLMETENFSAKLPLPTLLTTLPYSRKLYGWKLSSISFTGFDGYSTQNTSAAHQ